MVRVVAVPVERDRLAADERGVGAEPSVHSLSHARTEEEDDE